MGEPILLDADERRVIGVLIEKSLTTPQYYPLTVNAIVTGCNQKSNRDPVVEMVDEEIEEILERLRERDLVTVSYASGGRSQKWRQELTRNLELPGQQMAVLGELLLRGSQTVGELRARANRMKPIADLRALEEVLEAMKSHDPPLVRSLTPDGVKRGARVTHDLYPPAELQDVLAAEETLGAAPAPSAARRPGRSEDPELRAVVEDLRRRVEALEARLGGE